MRRVLAGAVLGLVLVAGGGAKVSGAPVQDCPAPRADLGIEYRFAAGDFVRAEDGGLWVRFLTEPTIVRVRAGGPAEGILLPGDAVVAAGGELITSTAGSRAFHFAPATGTVRLVVRRQGEPREVVVAPRPRCPEVRGAEPPGPGAEPAPKGGWLGVRLSCEECGLERVDGEQIWRFRRPPLVASVSEGSPAAVAGIRSGDTIAEIDGLDLGSEAGSLRLWELVEGQRVVLTLERDGVRRSVELVVAASPR